jgi:hypothetical protein
MNTVEILKLISPARAEAVRSEVAKAAAIRAKEAEARQRHASIKAQLPALEAEAAAARSKYDKDIAKAANARIFGGPAPTPDQNAVAIAEAALNYAKEAARSGDDVGFYQFGSDAQRHVNFANEALAADIAKHLIAQFRAIEPIWRLHNLLGRAAIPFHAFQWMVDGQWEWFFTNSLQPDIDHARAAAGALIDAITTPEPTTEAITTPPPPRAKRLKPESKMP